MNNPFDRQREPSKWAVMVALKCCARYGEWFSQYMFAASADKWRQNLADGKPLPQDSALRYLRGSSRNGPSVLAALADQGYDLERGTARNGHKYQLRIVRVK
jgi:hypothetical protein